MLQKPTKELVETACKEFTEDERYGIADKILVEIFSNCPNNIEIKDIYLKVELLNAFYNTNIYATLQMAKHILSLNIDNKLKIGDLSLVENIAIIEINGKKRNNYSFSTKYCNWHNNSNYPIYDSLVENILMEYQKETKFNTFKAIELRDYRRYKEIIDSFMKYFNISGVNYKELDKYLWLTARDK